MAKLLDAYGTVRSCNCITKMNAKEMLRYILPGWGGNQAISVGKRMSSDVGLWQCPKEDKALFSVSVKRATSLSGQPPCLRRGGVELKCNRKSMWPLLVPGGELPWFSWSVPLPCSASWQQLIGHYAWWGGGARRRPEEQVGDPE